MQPTGDLKKACENVLGYSYYPILQPNWIISARTFPAHAFLVILIKCHIHWVWEAAYRQDSPVCLSLSLTNSHTMSTIYVLQLTAQKDLGRKNI